MLIDVKAAAQLLKDKDNILILTHMNPDGDTLGSASALYHAFTGAGKYVRVANEEKIPAKFEYLFPKEAFEPIKPVFIMAVDVADSVLLGAELKEKYLSEVEVCIDHHGSNRLFAKNSLVDPSCSSNCEIILQLIKEMGFPIDIKVANAIYTGIATDTGCFRFANTNAQTHMAAAEMIAAGAEYSKINKQMFETKSFAYMKLEKLSLDTLKLYENGRVAVISVLQEFFEKSAYPFQDCDAICSIPRQIEGVDVGVTIKQRKDGSFKISVRTNEPYNAAKICMKLGGGGHAGAAGCEIQGDLQQVEKTLLKAIQEYLSEADETI